MKHNDPYIILHSFIKPTADRCGYHSNSYIPTLPIINQVKYNCEVSQLLQNYVVNSVFSGQLSDKRLASY